MNGTDSNHGSQSTRGLIGREISGFFDLIREVLPNPRWIATLIDYGPNLHLIGVMGVVNGKREDLADQPVIILENDPVSSSRDSKPLDL